MRIQGYVLLDDILSMLGLPLSEQYDSIGWVYDSDQKEIDFGVLDRARHEMMMFLEGKEPSIRLFFNIDGIIAIPF